MASAFEQRLAQIAVDGLTCLSIGLGLRLGLFDLMADMTSEEKPATSNEIAEKAGLKERYVREWLCSVAAAGLISITEDCKFWIDADRAKSFRKGTRAPFVVGAGEVPLLASASDALVDVFQKDGPLGLPYDAYSGFYSVMNELTEAMHGKHLFTDFMPSLPYDIEKRLHEGGMMSLDVGCGSGFHAALLAEKYPKSNFEGIDISMTALEMGNARRHRDGRAFDNLAFLQMDAGNMDPAWTNKFDWVTIFDSCHDQMRPDLCLKEINRVLKSGGVFTMLEIRGTSDPYKDIQMLGPQATFFYSVSLMHCLPVGSNSPDALCLGTMWGETKARSMLQEAGFVDIAIVPTPYFPMNLLYVARKP